MPPRPDRCKKKHASGERSPEAAICLSAHFDGISDTSSPGAIAPTATRLKCPASFRGKAEARSRGTMFLYAFYFEHFAMRVEPSVRASYTARRVTGFDLRIERGVGVTASGSVPESCCGRSRRGSAPAEQSSLAECPAPANSIVRPVASNSGRRNVKKILARQYSDQQGVQSTEAYPRAARDYPAACRSGVDAVGARRS